MKITVIPGNRLGPEHVALWSQIQRDTSSLDSPWFRPELVQVVASVRPDVEVAVLEEGGQTVGFFPFQRLRGAVACPVGGCLSDFQGVVARTETASTAAALLRGCGLSAWYFDHLLVSQQRFVPHYRVVVPSPFADLTGGFDAYRKGRHQAGFREISQALRKQPIAERQVGPLRFLTHTDDEQVFQSLLRWKADQYVRTERPNIFAIPWVVELLRRLRRKRCEDFAGVLSALYLGDRLAAVHLGLRCRGVLHYWFPAYDPALQRHSPGMLGFVEMARAAPALGIRRIDLGRGAETYKYGLASGAAMVAEGVVDLRPVIRELREAWIRSRDWIYRTPFGKPAKALANASRAWRNRWRADGPVPHQGTQAWEGSEDAGSG